jgi:hypothetical protein
VDVSSVTPLAVTSPFGTVTPMPYRFGSGLNARSAPLTISRNSGRYWLRWRQNPRQ